MLDSRLNALVLANINQKIIHTIEMDIFINKNLYLYNNILFNVYYLFYNIFLLKVLKYCYKNVILLIAY